MTPMSTATSRVACAAASRPLIWCGCRTIGSAIEDILLIAEYMPEEEIVDQVVVFLPFRG